MRERERRSLYHGAVGLAMLAGAVGCAGDPAPEPGAVETITGGEEPEAQILVDLRDDTRAWLFDGREGPLPLDDAVLVCPDGSWMRLAQWISQQESELGFSLGDRERALFALAAEEGLADEALAQAAPSCVRECQQCPDGAWICSSGCGRGSSTRESTDTSPYERFYDEHENAPRPGTGGSGSSGSDDDGDGSGGRWTPPDDGSGQPAPSF